MDEQDLPRLDDSLTQLPSDIRSDLAKRLVGDLYLFSKFVMGFTDMTVRAHGPLCVFLDSNPAQIKAAGMPRGTFKTSVGTISRGLQRVVQNPNRTQLIVNEISTNAQKFLGVIRQTAESNKIFRALYSSSIPRDTRKTIWNSEALLFNREVVRPEASITAIGILGTWTSQHYDDITFDDLIAEDAAGSKVVMEETTSRAKKFRALFVDPRQSTLTMLFTRWLFGDTYGQLFELIGQKNMAKMIRGAVDDDGPIFPERLPLEVLAQIRQEIKEYAFSCLYMNNPRNIEVQDFNDKDLRFWEFAGDRQDEVVLLDAEGHEAARYHTNQLDITATVDLAAAEKIDSDRNAVTVCGCTPNNEALVLESWAKRCTPIALMEQIFNFHRRWSPRVWGIEDVAYQASYKHFVQFFAEHEDLYINVKPIGAISRKETRIRGLQPVAATHRLFLHATQHILRSELADFPLAAHDDAADSLSMQLQVWRPQMSAKRWKRYAESEQAAIRAIDIANLSLTGVKVDEDNYDTDYKPAWYNSYDLGISERSA